mmetsp:Transcript_67018/g.218172  ORF Transcript_67018/g.218172 Transcript_67018/m.218172 type:complete len:399 (+) Transcript_67018:73-1269(+)
MDPEALEWHYLDRSGQEFGPFNTSKMRAWFSAGYFPIREKLLIRLTAWRKHATIQELWPDGEPFVGQHKEPGPSDGSAPSPAQSSAPAALGGGGGGGALPPPGHEYSGGYPGYGGAICGAPPAPAWGYPPAGYGYGGPAPGYPPPPGPYGYGGPPMMGYPPNPFGAPPMPYGMPPLGPGYGQYGYGRQESRSRSRSRGGGRRGGRGGRRDGGRDGSVGDRGFKPHHTNSVPKLTDLEGKFSSSDGPPTTGMLRNIPNKYMQDTLLEEMDDAGFAGQYDFFYLPMDVRNNANVGYAFVNFLRPEDFERFRRQFEGYQFKRAGSKKIAAVCPATVQGLRANIQNLMKKRVAQGQYRPLVYRHGKIVEIEVAAEELLRGDGGSSARSPPRSSGAGPTADEV